MKNRVLSIIVGVSLAIVLILVGVIGIIAGVRNATAVVKYDKIYVNAETLNYLAANYKIIYLKQLAKEGVECADSYEFWQSLAPDGISYGVYFESSLQEYIADLVVRANAYERHSQYTPEDRLEVAKICDGVLTRSADGDVEKFNEEAEKYGFSYDAFIDAATLMYKAKHADAAIEEHSLDVEAMKESVTFRDSYADIQSLSVPLLEKFHID